MHRCEKCDRPGQLVCQDAMPARRDGPESLHFNAWVFRYYLCRWHRSAWNRSRMPSQGRMVVLQHKPDSEVLANNR